MKPERRRVAPSGITRALLLGLVTLGVLTGACTRQSGDAQPVTVPPSSTPRTEVVPPSSTIAERPDPDLPAGLDRRKAPPHDVINWYVRNGLIDPADTGIDPRTPAAVGERQTFVVADEFSAAEVEAELVYATDAVALWVEVGAPVDPADYQFAATALTTEIIPAITDVFGPLPHPGVDGDGRVDILHLASLGSSAGEFGAADLLPRTLSPESNERELVYVNLASTVVGSDGYLATLAHELQHLIDAHVRPNTPLWLSEGFAQLAERIAGHNIIGTDTEFLASQPVQLNSWGALQLDGRRYGAAYLFSLYLWERFGSELIRDVAASPFDGLAGIDDALAGSGHTVEEVFADWAVANYLDDPALDPRYGYTTDDLRPVCPVDHVDLLPHDVSIDTEQFTARYHVLEGEGEVTVRFDGTQTTGPIPDLPHRGLWMWWSGRSDNSATRLTRTFDLSSVDRATLEYRIWHDAGLGDNAVVSVSTDGGRSWTPLEGRHSVPASEFFPAPSYTGTSGRGESPVWIGDEVDLTPFTGGDVLVRFEYITDLFENRVGMALDEIEIPEIGYVEGAEEPSDWDAEGFLRVPGTFEQPWEVRVINPAAAPPVRALPLEDGSGSARLDLAPGRPVAIMVAPVAPATSVATSYRLRVDGPGLVVTPPADEFTNECAGWDLDHEDEYSLRLDDGRLAIDLLEEQVFTWSARQGYLEDVTIRSTATFGAGTGRYGAAGLMCRISNFGFYDFEVSSDGYAFAGIAIGDDYEVLHDWREDGAINVGDGAVNDLELACEGSRLRLRVNGAVVIDVTDDRLTGGEVAVSGVSFDGWGFTVFYDDVTVSAPDSASLTGLVRYDDFSTDDVAWTLENNSRGVLEVRDGAYVATVRPPDWGIEGFAGVDVDNVILDLDVTVIENTPDGSITLACRNQPNGDQYLFLFGLDGFVSISAYLGGEFETLVDWDITDQLSTGAGDRNHVRIECIGPDLSLAANGVVVAHVQDDRLRSGDVSLGLFTFEHGNYIVAFDEIVIREAG